MNTEIIFTESEKRLIQQVYNRNLNKLIKVIVATIVVGALFYLIISNVSAEFLPSKTRGVKGVLTDSIGHVIPILLILTVITFIIIANVNDLKIRGLKQDLQEQLKITATLQVKRVNNLSDRDIKELRSVGQMKTSYLIFEENSFNIESYSFDKFELPHFLEAKELYIERAKYSKVEFKREVKK